VWLAHVLNGSRFLRRQRKMSISKRAAISGGSFSRI
jgi:hypothetical protein